jgi:predicted peroxiredoxin
LIHSGHDMPYYGTSAEYQPLGHMGNTMWYNYILIHVTASPEQEADYFSSFATAAYLQRYGAHVTMFFNGEGVNGLVMDRLEKMTGSPDAVKTITQQLGMPIPHFLHGDNPQNILEWALTFVRHGGRVTYCGTTNTWEGNAKEWTDRSNMEPFAIPLNIHQVAAILTNQRMKYVAF